MTTQVVRVPAGTNREDVQILQAALADAPEARERFGELLARDPSWIDRIGGLAADAERALLDSTKPSLVVDETWRADLDRLRTTLAQPGDGPLERLVIERVALTWLALSVAELRRAARWSSGVSSRDGLFWDRHVSRLNGDFLKASRALAMVRRLRIPPIQVNVGGQQVNIAG